jgi:hypothetical protein
MLNDFWYKLSPLKQWDLSADIYVKTVNILLREFDCILGRLVKRQAQSIIYGVAKCNRQIYELIKDSVFYLLFICASDYF